MQLPLFLSNYFNLFISMAAINNLQTDMLPKLLSILVIKHTQHKAIFKCEASAESWVPFKDVWRNRGHTERPLGCCVDALLDRHSIAKAKPCVVSPPSHLYTSLIFNYCCTALHWHAVIPAWIHTHKKLKGSFSLRGDRPADLDKGFKLSKLSLLGVPPMVL